MKIFYGGKEGNMPMNPAGVGLGNFDGLHIGHMTLINTLICESKLNSLESLVYTFKKHPENIIRKKLLTPLITTVNKKVELLDKTDLDCLYFDKFDESLSRMKPEAFVKDILVARLNIKLAVAGFDYRFGYMGQGDTELLKGLGKEHGFKVLVVPPVKVDDEVVSSTSIRKCIVAGDMEKATKLLGMHYSITGKVLTGKKLGRVLGYPTANLNPEEYIILPHEGVYVTKTLVNKQVYFSVTSVGKNPTVEENGSVSVETYILDFENNIYGENIEVFFISKLRDEKKFSSIEELVFQIEKDVLKVRQYFGM